MNFKLLFASVLLFNFSAALAAADADVIGMKDDAIYGVIGIAPVTAIQCRGVNMGIYTLSGTAYSGTITVTATTNMAPVASTLTISNPTGIAATSKSQPGTGYCEVSGLTAPTATDYKLILSNATDIPFVAGSTTDVTNPGRILSAAGTSVAGMSLTMSVVHQTPALEASGDNLFWRIAGVAKFENVLISTSSQYGGHISATAAEAKVAR